MPDVPCLACRGSRIELVNGGNGNVIESSCSMCSYNEVVEALELAVEWLEIDPVAEERGVVDRIKSALATARLDATHSTPGTT
jgi:hypothetical protein